MVKKVGEEAVVEEKIEQFGQKIPVEPPVESTEPEPAQEESLETLRAKLTELESAKEEAIREAKAHQQNVSKKERELQRSRDFEAKIQALEEKLGVAVSMVADIMDRDSAEVEMPTTRRSEQYLTKFKDAGSSTQKAQQTYQDGIFAEIGKLAAGAGVDLDSRELAQAKNLWYEGKPEDALDEVKQVVEKMTEAKKEPVESDEEKKKKWVEEGKRLAMEEAKALGTDTGGPHGSTGRSFTRQQIREMSPAEYKENRPAIEAAMAAERIK